MKELYGVLQYFIMVNEYASVLFVEKMEKTASQ